MTKIIDKSAYNHSKARILVAFNKNCHLSLKTSFVKRGPGNNLLSSPILHCNLYQDIPLMLHRPITIFIQFHAYVYQEWKTDLLWWNLDCGYAKLFKSSLFLQISKLCISKWSSRISHPVNSEELYMFKQNKWYINHCYTKINWFVKTTSEIHRIIFFMTIKSISNFVQVTVFLFFFTTLQRL